MSGSARELAEEFGMVIEPGVVRLATSKTAIDTNATFTTREPREKLPAPKLTQFRRDGARSEKITGCSKKSRTRIVRVSAGLDYSPLLDSGRLPAMIVGGSSAAEVSSVRCRSAGTAVDRVGRRDCREP